MGSQWPRLSFIGAGRVGVTYAICLSELGCQVIVLGPETAGPPDRELDGMRRRNLASGRLRFTSSYRDVADFADVHHLCVGSAADLAPIAEAVQALGPHLSRRSLLVGKTTVPPGTAAFVERLVARHSAADLGVEVAWSPEFLAAEATARDVLRPDRLVLGTRGDWAKATLLAAHAAVLRLAAVEGRSVHVLHTDVETAELVTLAINAFLATGTSFINAMSVVCEATGANIRDLTEAITGDRRIGAELLRPGIGFDLDCLPGDIRALQARAGDLGAGEAVRFLSEVDQINLRQRTRAVNRAAGLLGRPPGPAGPDLTGTRIAVLGIAPHPSGDGGAAAAGIASSLARAGAEVRIYDPDGDPLGDPRDQPSPELAVIGADLLCVMTARAAQAADPVVLGALAASKRVLDGRHCLDPARWAAAGWQYAALGSPAAATTTVHHSHPRNERGKHYVTESTSPSGSRYRVPGGRLDGARRLAERRGEEVGRPD